MEQIQKEYEILRHEIDQKIELHNTLLTFIITSTILVLTVAASEDIVILYLVPFCIIIPMAGRIAHYQKAVAKLSAYIIVFLEPKLKNARWESRNYIFSKYYGDLSNKNNKFKLSCFECIALGVVCYLLYLFNYMPAQLDELTTFTVAGAIWPIILLLWLLFLTFKMSRMDKDRQKLIEMWNDIKEKESLEYIREELTKK